MLLTCCWRDTIEDIVYVLAVRILSGKVHVVPLLRFYFE